MDVISPGPDSRPDQRYRIAHWHVCQGRQLPRDVDCLVTHCASYLAAQQSADPVRRHSARQKSPALACAIGIHLSNDALRAHLEALYLARQPISAIAEACDVSVAVIQWYLLLFFDVQRRLGDAAYILRFLSATSRQRDPWGYLLRVASYLGDHDALGKLKGTCSSEYALSIRSYFEGRSELLRTLTVATALEHAEPHLLYPKLLAATAKQGDPEPNGAERALQQILENLPLEVIGPERGPHFGEGVTHIGGLELNQADRTALKQGLTPERLWELLNAPKYPEPGEA